MCVCVVVVGAYLHLPLEWKGGGVRVLRVSSVRRWPLPAGAGDLLQAGLIDNSLHCI
jgi:hypothetical protein